MQQKKERDKVPLLMFSQRNNPYCELLQICTAKILWFFEITKLNDDYSEKKMKKHYLCSSKLNKNLIHHEKDIRA